MSQGDDRKRIHVGDGASQPRIVAPCTRDVEGSVFKAATSLASKLLWAENACCFAMHYRAAAYGDSVTERSELRIFG
jgi:hypothetical protein